MTDTITESPLARATEALCGAGPDWLAAARREALAEFDAAALPPRSQHLWRYTDPAKLLPGEREVTAPGAEFGELPTDFSDGLFEKTAGYATLRDGRLLRTALDTSVEKQGVVVEDLLTAAQSRSELVREHLFALSASGDSRGRRFERLSAALFGGGAFVHIPAGKAIGRPIRIAARHGGKGLQASRSLLIAERASESTVVFDLSSADEDSAALLHEGVELFVGDGARLRVIWVQDLNRKTIHAPVIRARVGRDAVLETVTVAFGGALVKSLATAEMTARGAETRSLGIVFGDRRQHFDHHTVMDHVADHTQSDLDFRTVMAGRARSAYTGLLQIGVDGAGCEAHQTNHNLLLTKTARADTIPELEILTDDVKCSHAAAVGPIDEEQVYYCMSRGYSRDEARRMIVMGFLEATVGRIPGEELLGRVRAALEERLSEVTG